MKKSRDIEEILTVKYLPGREHMESIQCRICKDMFHEGGTSITKGEFQGLLSAIKLHFRLQHDIDIGFRSCDNPQCFKSH